MELLESLNNRTWSVNEGFENNFISLPCYVSPQVQLQAMFTPDMKMIFMIPSLIVVGTTSK